MGFSGGSDGKESAFDAEDLGLIPGLGRSPGEGNGTPLQYSCLENPMDREARQTIVHGIAKSRTRLSDFTFTFTACGILVPQSRIKPMLLSVRVLITGLPANSLFGCLFIQMFP